MELEKPKEYQTIRLFATLGLLTLMVVLILKVVLFAPPGTVSGQVQVEIQSMPNLQPTADILKTPVFPNK